jgi:hypothetical protein
VANLDLTRLKAPKTLIARIRLAWPDVQAALNGGHSLKAVHQRLAEAGIKISNRRLSEYVGRLPREEKLRTVPRRNVENYIGGPDSPAGSSRPSRGKSSLIDPTEERVCARSTAYDPMADFVNDAPEPKHSRSSPDRPMEAS